MVSSESTPRLVTLKDLVPLCPWKTPAPPFPGNQNGQYVKVKKPLQRGGTKVFWAPKTVLLNEDEDIESLTFPFEGLFEFFDVCVVNNIKRWIDRLLGQIFSLPKYDVSNKRILNDWLEL